MKQMVGVMRTLRCGTEDRRIREGIEQLPISVAKGNPIAKSNEGGIRRGFTEEIGLTALRGQKVSISPHLVCMSRLPGILDHL